MIVGKKNKNCLYAFLNVVCFVENVYGEKNINLHTY